MEAPEAYFVERTYFWAPVNLRRTFAFVCEHASLVFELSATNTCSCHSACGNAGKRLGKAGMDGIGGSRWTVGGGHLPIYPPWNKHFAPENQWLEDAISF